MCDGSRARDWMWRKSVRCGVDAGRRPMLYIDPRVHFHRAGAQRSVPRGHRAPDGDILLMGRAADRRTLQHSRVQRRGDEN